MQRLAFLFIYITLFTSNVHAYYETLDNGDILKKGEYQLMLVPQFLLSGRTGFNIGANFDFGFNESSNFRANIGTGNTQFFGGISYKWIPIPDYNDQPAIGLIGGFLYGAYDNISIINFKVSPLISKKFKTEWSQLTPYASLPISISASQGSTIYPLQFVLGSEVKPTDLKKLSFFAELGLNLSNSFNYISLAAALQFDEENGFKVE